MRAPPTIDVARTLLRRVIDSLADGVVVADLGGRCGLFNPANAVASSRLNLEGSQEANPLRQSGTFRA